MASDYQTNNRRSGCHFVRDGNHGLRKHRNAAHPVKPYVLETCLSQQDTKRGHRPKSYMPVIAERREVRAHLPCYGQSDVLQVAVVKRRNDRLSPGSTKSNSVRA